ncbi:hypothetical protein FHG87_014164 [Trinorchestia longiramus]|nr:hypothetical protein FHG87_014164 [Trinorchestia longiramus]
MRQLGGSLNLAEIKTWANKFRLKKKLFNMKLENGQKLQDHLKVFVELFEELAIICDAMEEEERVFILLSSLPDRFSTLVTALEANEKIPAWEVLTGRLLNEERRQRGGPGTSDSSEKLLPRDILVLPGNRKLQYITLSIDKDQVLRETFDNVQILQQKNVFLLVDGVQIRPTVSFSGGLLSGMAENNRDCKVTSILITSWISEKGQKISLDNETRHYWAGVKELYESKKGSILTTTTFTQFAVNPSNLLPTPQRKTSRRRQSFFRPLSRKPGWLTNRCSLNQNLIQFQNQNLSKNLNQNLVQNQNQELDLNLKEYINMNLNLNQYPNQNLNQNQNLELNLNLNMNINHDLHLIKNLNLNLNQKLNLKENINFNFNLNFNFNQNWNLNFNLKLHLNMNLNQNLNLNINLN